MHEAFGDAIHQRHGRDADTEKRRERSSLRRIVVFNPRDLSPNPCDGGKVSVGVVVG